MKRLLLAALLVFSMSGEALARGSNREYIPRDVMPCVEYLDAYARTTLLKENDFKGPHEFFAAAGWVGGFITTYNSYVQNGKRDIIEGMTANDALRWVASWCRDNSSRDLEYALEALIESRD